MASKTKTFGAILREKRLDGGFGLREFATMVGVSSTYISQLEQENIDPQTAERASALILGLAFLAIVCSPFVGGVKFVLLRKAWSPENRNTSIAI
jgi:transcriptional regulator with XRE-family HTH domain